MYAAIPYAASTIASPKTAATMRPFASPILSAFPAESNQLNPDQMMSIKKIVPKRTRTALMMLTIIFSRFDSVEMFTSCNSPPSSKSGGSPANAVLTWIGKSAEPSSIPDRRNVAIFFIK